jgi:chromosome transmission fidelity protein 1
LEQLTAYISRFKNRLASKHVLHLKRLYRLLHTLKGLLSNWQQQENSNAVMTVDGLLSKLGGKLEEINFLEIQNYLRKSKARRNPLIRPSKKHLPMTIASKENHDVHAEGESKVRAKG